MHVNITDTECKLKLWTSFVVGIMLYVSSNNRRYTKCKYLHTKPYHQEEAKCEWKVKRCSGESHERGYSEGMLAKDARIEQPETRDNDQVRMGENGNAREWECERTTMRQKVARNPSARGRECKNARRIREDENRVIPGMRGGRG